ncbi:hypothetical protein ACFY04_06095 [Streptomyces sp. NPDC001549]
MTATAPGAASGVCAVLLAKDGKVRGDDGLVSRPRTRARTSTATS